MFYLMYMLSLLSWCSQTPLQGLIQNVSFEYGVLMRIMTAVTLFLPCLAVRTGNLAKFNQALDQFGEKFQADGTYTLIIRLRHNVIKTGEYCS